MVTLPFSYYLNLFSVFPPHQGFFFYLLNFLFSEVVSIKHFYSNVNLKYIKEGMKEGW